MPKAQFLVIPGSDREGSVNTKLAQAIALALEDAGATAATVKISDYDLPIYDGDLENKHGVPESAKNLAELICEHDGVVLVAPEYNGSITPLMKNMMDWMSRDVGVKPYKDRVYALASCSPGALGGIRGINHMRDVLVSVVADVIVPQICVGGAGDAFDETGRVKQDRHKGLLQNMVDTLIARTS